MTKDEALKQINTIQKSLIEKGLQHQKLIKDILAADNRVFQAQQAQFILKEQSNAMGHEIDKTLKELKTVIEEYAEIVVEEECKSKWV